MNSRGLIVLALLAVLSLAPVAGAVHADGETRVTVSTEDVSCEAEAVCPGPGVTARVTAQHPSVEDGVPDVSCLTKATQGDKMGLPSCDLNGPDIDPAVLRTYLAVDGLDPDDGGEDGGPDASSQQTTGDSWNGLGIEAEAAALIGALGLGASGAAAFVGLRRFIGVLLAPLASRLTRSEILENDIRRRIYEAIEEQPGINLRGLADEIEVAWGTLLHHLKKLEDAHLVKSERYGKYRRFFKNGASFSPEEQERIAALSTPSTARVAEYILENPGANQSEIGEEIGVTASTILFHVNRLKEVGLVEEEREGRYVHYYPCISGEEAQHMGAA